MSYVGQRGKREVKKDYMSKIVRTYSYKTQKKFFLSLNSRKFYVLPFSSTFETISVLFIICAEFIPRLLLVTDR